MYQAIRPLSLLAFAFLTVPTPAQTAALTIQPRGAYATAGTVHAARVGTRYEFTYDGGALDESLTYAIDMSHADVLSGLIRIEELSSGSMPIAKGGLGWRTGVSDTLIDTPAVHAQTANALLYHEHLDLESGKL